MSSKKVRKNTHSVKEKTYTPPKSSHIPLIIKIAFMIGFLFIAYIAFYQLGMSPLENWDEAWYADVTRNMLQTKEFFVLYWNNALWLDKPPLYMWITALVASIIGLSEFSVRVPSAISGVIIVMIVTWFSYRNYGFAPAFLAFVTLALNNVFVWRMRSGNIDLLATLLILLVFILQISKIKYKYPLLGLLFACIYLTKASLVLLPLTMFVLYEVLFERKHIISKYKQYILLFFIAILPPALWLLMGTLKIGLPFSEYYLFKSDQGVASVSFNKFNLDYIMYTYYSLQRRFFFVFVAGILFAIRYIKDSKVLLMLLYATALIVQLSFTERSNNWYLIPAMPFWSLLIAFGTYHILKLFKNNIIITVALIAVTSVLAFRTYTINIIPVLNTSANEAQMQSGKQINALSDPDDVVVRLDHLYPTTVYYTDRRVLSSPDNVDNTEGFWLTRASVIAMIESDKVQWIVGNDNDVAAFQLIIPDQQVKVIRVNDEETILQVL